MEFHSGTASGIRLARLVGALALCFLPAMGAVIVVPSILNLLDFAGSLGGG